MVRQVVVVVGEAGFGGGRVVVVVVVLVSEAGFEGGEGE